MTTQATAPSQLSTPALAVGSVAAALGALSLIPYVGLLFGFFGFFAGTASVIIGHMAVAKSGDKRARRGLALGYVGLGLTIGWLVIRTIAAQL